MCRQCDVREYIIEDCDKVETHSSKQTSSDQTKEDPPRIEYIHKTNSSCKPSLQRLPSGYVGKEVKPANSYLRWNLLFTVVILIFLTFPFWFPVIPVVQDFSLELVLIVLAILNILWFVAVCNVIRYTIRLRMFASHRIELDKVTPPGRNLKHLVGICIYKEPLELMYETLDSVARQAQAKDKISVVVGFEDGTPDRKEKSRSLRNRYEPIFERFIIAVHPKNLPGDIPGKCSNLNFAMRHAVSKLKQDMDYCNKGELPELLVTTGDCDSVFGERYFNALEEDFWKVDESERNATVWQSPLFYTMAKESSPFFVRVTGILRSFFMMGYLIPFNINTMSIFSLTLVLLEKGEYTHPGYQMEDIIAVIRWSLAIRKRCTIRCIPVATLSGPTSGHSYLNELYEWARQIRRWTIGAAEVFHYFAIKSLRLPVRAAFGFMCIFIFYYGFILCISALFGLIAPIFVPIILSAVGQPVKGLIIPNQKTFAFISLGFLGLQYFWFLLAFVLHKLCEKVFPDGRRDNVGFFKAIGHYILSWPTILMYSCVELFAFLEVTIRGKAVCSHSASKKENLLVGAENGLFTV